MGVAPTGKQVTVSGLPPGIANGKVVEEYTNWDTCPDRRRSARERRRRKRLEIYVRGRP
jgi:hypothetical protein